jgi:hypothetical protein
LSSAGEAPKPPWRDLFTEDALRRLVRLAALRDGEKVVWIGAADDRSAKELERLSELPVERRASLDGLAAQRHGLIVAPELVAERGLDAALGLIRPPLETDGVCALVVRVFVGSEAPEPLRKHWEAKLKDQLRSVKATIARLSALGFEPMTCELLGEPALSEHDAKLLAEAQRGAQGGASAEAKAGVRHGTALGLLIGRRVEPGAPPRWPRRGGGE